VQKKPSPEPWLRKRPILIFPNNDRHGKIIRFILLEKPETPEKPRDSMDLWGGDRPLGTFYFQVLRKI
jgi:hypothetical protein